MAPKLNNRSLRPGEAEEMAAIARMRKVEAAKAAAKLALSRWYLNGFHRANVTIPELQRESNSEEVALIPGWRERIKRNGYIMLFSLFSGTLTPVIIALDYTRCANGGLTYRQLHKQVREYLRLEPKQSLRLIPFRPWYLHIHEGDCYPEARALRPSDAQCKHLLETTFIYLPPYSLLERKLA